MSNVLIVKNSELGRKLVISIDIQKPYEERLNKYKREGSVKGFRPGKVPVKYLDDKFRTSFIADILNGAVQAGIQEAITENNLEIMGYPEVVSKLPEIDAIDPYKTFDLEVEIELKPDFSLADFSTAEVEKEKFTPKSEEIARYKEQLRVDNSTFVKNEKEVKVTATDKVSITYSINFPKEQELDGKENISEQYVLGNNQLLPEIEDEIVGKEVGDSFKVTKEYPDDFANESFRGKTVEFNVLIDGTEQVELPSDELLAEKLGLKEYSAEKLAELIEQSLQKYVEPFIVNKFHENILAMILDKHSFNLPEKLLSKRIAEHKTAEGKDSSLEESEKKAEKEIRSGILISEIASEFKLSIDEKEAKEEALRKFNQFMYSMGSSVSEEHQKKFLQLCYEETANTLLVKTVLEKVSSLVKIKEISFDYSKVEKIS